MQVDCKCGTKTYFKPVNTTIPSVTFMQLRYGKTANSTLWAELVEEHCPPVEMVKYGKDTRSPTFSSITRATMNKPMNPPRTVTEASPSAAQSVVPEVINISSDVTTR